MRRGIGDRRFAICDLDSAIVIGESGVGWSIANRQSPIADRQSQIPPRLNPPKPHVQLRRVSLAALAPAPPLGRPAPQ